MSRIAVVTDSTASLTAEVANHLGVAVVPLNVIIDGRVFSEGVDIDSAELASAMRSGANVSTSRANPGAFSQIYQQLAATGVDGIVSMHVSGDLSGTYQSALFAGRDAPVPVEVLDSRSVAMGLGFAVEDAANAAATGASLAEVARAGAATAEVSSVLFYVDTLTYLQKGGRIGTGQRIVGQALSMKPILHLENGQVESLEKVRTRGRALARLADLAVERSGAAGSRLAVQHLDALARAEDLAATLSARLGGRAISVTDVGATIGAHVGPGMVSVAVVPPEPSP